MLYAYGRGTSLATIRLTAINESLKIIKTMFDVFLSTSKTLKDFNNVIVERIGYFTLLHPNKCS